MQSQRKRGQHHRYERLGGSSCSSGSGKPRRKHSWRIRIAPRLRVLRFGYAKKLLVRLREAYVKMVVRLARGGERRIRGTGRPSPKEYDGKAMAQIHRCLMVQGQMTGGVGSVVAWFSAEYVGHWAYGPPSAARDEKNSLDRRISFR
ncbi:hypothetical protein ACLOJK_017722 [Asimina triloba]